MRFLELRIPPVALILLCALGMWFTRSCLPSLHFAFSGRKAVAGLLACAGLSIGMAAVMAFRAARTSVDPRFPERSAAIVTTGIYAWSRNPMYLGLLLLLLGWGIFLGSGIVLVFPALFVIYMNRFQILPEERSMASKFGDEYRRYTESVRRWI